MKTNSPKTKMKPKLSKTNKSRNKGWSKNFSHRFLRRKKGQKNKRPLKKSSLVRKWPDFIKITTQPTNSIDLKLWRLKPTFMINWQKYTSQRYLFVMSSHKRWSRSWWKRLRGSVTRKRSKVWWNLKSSVIAISTGKRRTSKKWRKNPQH